MDKAEKLGAQEAKKKAAHQAYMKKMKKARLARMKARERKGAPTQVDALEDEDNDQDVASAQV